MPLLDVWRKSPADFDDKHVRQVLSFAGSGKLTNGSRTSIEFRSLLSHIPSRILTRYADECLAEKLEQGGLALQDVVNEIGRRLGFQVEDGRYTGAQGESGHDGLWLHEHNAIVVEVKTSSTFSFSLATLAGYRSQLVSTGRISEEKSSILIVVGRYETGELEGVS